MKHLAILIAVLTLSACQQDEPALSGYVEGEYVYVSPTSGGILQTLNVSRGQKITTGDPLFSLERQQLEADRNAALADLAQAESNLANLTKGMRQEEANIIIKRKDEADATLRNARIQYERSRKLVAEKIASKARLDEDKAAFESAQARVAAVAAELEASTLGARSDEIAAAQAGVDVAQQRVAQSEKRLGEISPVSSVAGIVEDTYFRPGEFVPAGTPVVSLLPPENVKIRFFLPQAKIAAVTLGSSLTVRCDGCTADVPAKITYISSQAEFTPPVIYSVGSRDKLVFMLEAKPDTYHPELHPGLPIDITLAGQQVK